MKIRKRVITLILSVMLTLIQIVPVYAEENNEEWYEMIEESFDMTEPVSEAIMPYTLYIMNIITSTVKLSSSKLGMRADVLCASTVRSINVTFYLQKKSGTSWVNVASKTSSTSYNVSNTAKQMTVSGLSSGTYRTKAVAYVTDSSGYGETLTGYSGSLTI